MPKTRDSRGSPKEQGMITPVLAACLAVGLGFLALSVDLGQLFVAKNELQNIADAAALAGAKKLIQAKDPANPDLAAVYCSDAISHGPGCSSRQPLPGHRHDGLRRGRHPGTVEPRHRQFQPNRVLH